MCDRAVARAGAVLSDLGGVGNDRPRGVAHFNATDTQLAFTKACCM
jgi:hypothetical protein